MAFDVVKKILDTEKEGEELLKRAQSLAAEINKKSREESEALMEKAKLTAEDDYNKIIFKYENEAKVASEPLLEESRNSRMKLTNIPTELMDRAVNMVIERIVNSHGNS